MSFEKKRLHRVSGNLKKRKIRILEHWSRHTGCASCCPSIVDQENVKSSECFSMVGVSVLLTPLIG